MGIIDKLEEASSKAADAGKDYADFTVEYYELKVFKQLSGVFTLLSKLVLIGSFVLLGFVFLALALAFTLSSKLDSNPLGFSIVALIALVLGGIIYMFRKRIDRKIIRKLSKTFFN